MKLSTAIRDGAKFRPQAFSGPGGIYQSVTSCAIVAALEAVTGSIDRAVRLYWTHNADVGLFPVLDCEVTDPTCASKQDTLWHVITELNDGKKWSRERIADYVETVEEYQAIAATADAYATV